MGSFAYTCALSGLPIEAGDDVRWFMVTENPYERHYVCGLYDLWFPRTWPLTAKYNDYGSIERYDESDVIIRSIIDGLKEDLIETGVGDNSIHDVEARKGMSFEDTLVAIQEGRIRVERDNSRRFYKRLDTVGVADCIPTFQKVEELLKNYGFSIGVNAGEFIVCDMEYGWVRVRPGGYGNDYDGLEYVLVALQEKYAAVITTGSGNYSYSPEIQVMPKPNKDNKSFLYKEGKDKPLIIQQAMIHGRIWDEIIKDDKYLKYRKAVEENWNNALKMDAASIRYELRETYVQSTMFRSAIPFSYGLGEHTLLLMDYHKEKSFTEKQLGQLFDDMAGLMIMSEVMMDTRQYFKPSYSCGSQFAEYENHTYWNGLVAVVADEIDAERKLERGETNLQLEEEIEKE